LTLANGEEIVIRKFNVNALVLYLLAIICSYKSGYTTKMAKDPVCRNILKQLVRLVLDKKNINLDDYIDGYMYYEHDKEKKKNEDYYKQYSNIAKQTIKKEVDNSDEVIYYLFENTPISGRQSLRHTILDTDSIKLPEELMELARNMPDAIDVLKQSDNQMITTPLME
jgi:hydroxymethylpyrimidine pyrophosphatase-like HAD family hydrolase